MSHPRTLLSRTLVARTLGTLSVGALASCGAAPADVAGTYAINLTNGPNACMVMNWTDGNTTTGVPLTVTQDGPNFTATVTGVAATYLDLVAGAHTFSGTVTGRHLDGLLVGRAGSMGGCAYTLNVALDADLTGDLLEGELRWYADTNTSPDCGVYATCTNRQALNGTRPPR